MVRTWFAQIRTWFAEDSHKFAQQSQHSPRFTEIRANSHLVHTVAKFARIRTESQAFALPSHAVALTSHGVAQDSHKIRTKFAKIHTLFSPILTGRTCELVTPTHHVSHALSRWRHGRSWHARANFERKGQSYRVGMQLGRRGQKKFFIFISLAFGVPWRRTCAGRPDAALLARRDDDSGAASPRRAGGDARHLQVDAESGRACQAATSGAAAGAASRELLGAEAGAAEGALEERASERRAPVRLLGAHVRARAQQCEVRGLCLSECTGHRSGGAMR